MHTKGIHKYILFFSLLLVAGKPEPPKPVSVVIGLPDDLYNQAAKRKKLCEILNWPDAGWKKVCPASNTNNVWYLYDVTERQIKVELTAQKKDKLKAVFNDSRAKFERGLAINGLMKKYDFIYHDWE